MDTSAADRDDRERSTAILLFRIAAALIQAAALYLLASTAAAKAWPATVPELFEPLVLLALFLPLLVILGIGQVRPVPLVAWAAIATLVVAGLGLHDATRGGAAVYAATEVFRPASPFCLALVEGLFIAHALVVAAVAERRFIPPYPRQFDTARKLGLQIALAAIFVGVFWGVLTLGASLFQLVGIALFLRLIAHSWFAMPATTLALAVAIHATDVRPGLIRGVRTVVLTLFSWLLPLLAAILAGFLGSLPFVSLARLWSTHFAGRLLLVAAVLLVLLINSCYQDGAAEQTRSRMKRIAVVAASIELLFLVGLAAWALALRVGQYGWTVERIIAVAVIIHLGCYAVGYASAVLPAPRWMQRVEITNFAAAYVFLALVIALFTPLADPARLMVASQVARLEAGKVPPEKFEFAALKFDGARWGAAALAALSRRKDNTTIAERAAHALTLRNRFAAAQATQRTPAELVERVTVSPDGQVLPSSFYAAISKLDAKDVPFCFRAQAGAPCRARLANLGAGHDEAILLADTTTILVFEHDAAGTWRKTAQLMGPFYCSAVRDALMRGEFTLEAHAMPDIVVGDKRLIVAAPWHGC